MVFFYVELQVLRYGIVICCNCFDVWCNIVNSCVFDVVIVLIEEREIEDVNGCWVLFQCINDCVVVFIGVNLSFVFVKCMSYVFKSVFVFLFFFGRSLIVSREFFEFGKSSFDFFFVFCIVKFFQQSIFFGVVVYSDFNESIVGI